MQSIVGNRAQFCHSATGRAQRTHVNEKNDRNNPLVDFIKAKRIFLKRATLWSVEKL